MIRKIFIFILLLAITNTFSQTTGDYRTKGTATFSASTNWETWNGTDWVTAAIAPYNPSNTTQTTSGASATTAITLSAANSTK